MIDDLSIALARRFAEATAEGDLEGAESWARAAFSHYRRITATFSTGDEENEC